MLRVRLYSIVREYFERGTVLTIKAHALPMLVKLKLGKYRLSYQGEEVTADIRTIEYKIRVVVITLVTEQSPLFRNIPYIDIHRIGHVTSHISQPRELRYAALSSKLAKLKEEDVAVARYMLCRVTGVRYSPPSLMSKSDFELIESLLNRILGIDDMSLSTFPYVQHCRRNGVCAVCGKDAENVGQLLPLCNKHLIEYNENEEKFKKEYRL